MPSNIDPTGAPSPFDKQNITESTGRARSATVSPSAVAALKMRAPSRWTGNFIACASFANLFDARARHHRSAGEVVRILDRDQTRSARRSKPRWREAQQRSRPR